MRPGSIQERRKHARHPLCMGLRFHHPQSQREFPGRTVDISQSGLLMYVPARTPLKVGDALELNLGSMPRPEYATLGANPVQATVVRVARETLLATGQIAVGVKFMTQA